MKNRMFESFQHPGEVFTVEPSHEEGEFQTVYPEALAEFGEVFDSELDAWDDLFNVAADLNLQLTSLKR